MKKFIATTTIYEPSIAIRKYAAMNDWTLVIAGDLKTPHDKYSDICAIYLTPEEQQSTYTRPNGRNT